MGTANSLQQLLQNHTVATNDQKYISHEFQDYAYRLAMEITTPEDRETIGMCMHLAKSKPRALLDQAVNYVKDANAKNKVALFLWKLKELEKEKKDKEKLKKDDAPKQTPLPWE